MAKDSTKTFSIDTENAGGDMPSVTKLLLRKSLKPATDKTEDKDAAQQGPKAAKGPAPPEPHSTIVPETTPEAPSLEIPIAPESSVSLELETPSQAQSPPEAKPSPVGPDLSDQGPSLEIKIDTGPDISLEIERSTPPTPVQPAAPTLEAPVTVDLGTNEPVGEISIGTPEGHAEVPLGAHSGAHSGVPSEPPPPEVIESQSQLLRVLKAAPRKRPPAKSLILWEPAQLLSGKDPLGKGIVHAFKKGAAHALFLAISAPPPGKPTPIFLATAAVDPGDKLATWTGLKWDPQVVPDLWNIFIHAGIVELPPPSSLTNQFSNRNVIRAGFGILPSEYLLLVRAGPANGCRGVVALVSTISLMQSLDEALPLIQASASSSKSAA